MNFQSYREMFLVHAALEEAMKLWGPGELTNKVLEKCPDAECPICSRIVCPHKCPLHFHHDGCPACAEVDHAN